MPRVAPGQFLDENVAPLGQPGQGPVAGGFLLIAGQKMAPQRPGRIKADFQALGQFRTQAFFGFSGPVKAAQYAYRRPGRYAPSPGVPDRRGNIPRLAG